MFLIQNVPIAIEPGVNAIEAEFFATERKNKTRVFPVHLFRVALDEQTAPKLPFVTSIKTPHVFGLAHNPDDSIVLVVYDALGRIHTVYTRDDSGRAWEKRFVADEHAGKTVKQFSVRYIFGSEKSRDDFMRRVDNIITALEQNNVPPAADVAGAFRLLSRARVSPVVLPVAVAKSAVKKVKL
jgi:hypothetical protein